ncbi:MAG: TonB-dependent receptor [Bacteroidetes bacterium]|nr:MAG: TonB-dependent receptor [Bacteroidota bacterium]
MKNMSQNLIRKLSLAFASILIGITTWAQLSITGTVIDEGGEPLPGVSIVIQGTSTGTITNIDGTFTLSAPADATLLFSFVGMKTVVEPVNGRTTINVSMQPDAIGLEEVVAVGYGVQKKATLTGAIGNVKSEELLQRPVANTTELLQGQVAGLVTRQTSGLPGADGTTLSIRGFGNPLVLIDGIEGALAQVDPNDIESVSVLKDASASVYGARAGNGVVLVTTKRGSERKTQITYHGSVSFTKPTFLPKHVDATKWAEMLNETGLKSDDYSPAHIRWNAETKTLNNIVTGEQFYGYDWSKALYRDWTPQQQHNVSASGGSQKVKYFISAGFTDQESTFKAGDFAFNRYNIRSNIDASITQNLSATVDFSYRITNLDKANFDVEDMYNSLQTAKPVYPYVHENDLERGTYSGFLQRSPYSQTFKDFSGSINNRDNVIQGALELKYKFPMVKGLSAKARLTYEDAFAWDKTIAKPFDVWEYDQVADSQGKDPWVKRGTQNTNNLRVFSSRSSLLLPLFSLEYENTFGNHNVKGTLISETRTYKFTSLTGTRKDVLSYEAPYLRYASEEGKDNSEGTDESARSSIIGRLNYDYLGKYLFEFAMRADASAEYPPETRWGYFPSFSAGWRISEESFIRDNFNAVNNLKLRGSYGILGNDAVSSFDYLTGYTISTNFYIFGTTPVPIINSAGLANPNITWETMKISNIGLDGTLWDGLLGFEIDAFYRLRENILAQPTEQVPSTFGASLPLTNLNKRDNRGIEITLTHMNKIGNVSYDISPMFSWTRGKFVELDEDVLPVTGDLDAETLEFNKLWNARYVNEGQWDDRQWGFISDGFFMNQDEIDNYTINQDQNDNKTIKVGDIKYKDINGDNYIDWRDQQVIGKNGLPKMMYSLDMGANWKGLGLRMLWTGGSDYIVTFSGSAAAPFSNESIPLVEHYENRAILGTDADGKAFISNPDDFKLPPVNMAGGNTPNNAKGSDFWTYDAAFVRLKNLNVSYTLPKQIFGNVGINNCVLYFSGTNLLSFSNLGIWKKSFDPEVPGADNRDYPPVKTMSFGLRLTL